MDIILTRHTSLALLRAVRRSENLELCATDVTSCPDDLLPPKELGETLAFLAPLVGGASPEMPHQVVLARQVRKRGGFSLASHVSRIDVPKGSYLEVRAIPRPGKAFRPPEGVRVLIEGPSLALVSYAKALLRRVSTGDLPTWLAVDMVIALGNELCGTYARDAMNPFGGACAYDLGQMAHRDGIERELGSMSSLAGLALARRAIPHVADRSASPMETLHHMMETLPPKLAGLSMGCPQLNERIEPTPQQQRVLTVKSGIRPDLYWRQWKIAVEHDGEEGHLTRRGWRSDHERIQDYQVCGIRVFTATFDDVRSTKSFNAFAEKLCVAIAEAGSPGVARRARSLMRNREFRARQGKLLSVLLPHASHLDY